MNKTEDCCEEPSICEGFSDAFELIHDINKKFEKLQRQAISNDELTTAQYFILRQLWVTDGLQFKDLANACNCSRSTITGVIDTMEKKNLVKRVSHPNDRRSILVKLTEKGMALKETTPTLDSLTNNCCKGINQDELDTLCVLLRKVSDSLVF